MDKKIKTLGERIAWALEHHPDGKKSQIWLGKELRVSQPAVSEWIRNLSAPKNKDLLALKLKVSVDWLRTGEGPEEAPPPHLPADLEAFITATAALVAADGGESAKQRALSEITEWLDARHSENQPADPLGLLTQLRVIKARIAKEDAIEKKKSK